MLFQLLNSATNSGTNTTNPSNPWMSWITIGLFAVLMIVFFITSRRSQKKREEESKKILDALKPGHKVKTIGGICGTVYSVSDVDNTFVMETGSGDHKSYLTFDKYAIANTDAEAEVKAQTEPKKEETKTESQETEGVTRHSGEDVE